MAMTLGEMLQELEQHRYDAAVWAMLVNKLCTYLDQDKHRQADAGLKVKGCSETYVPASVFERIIERLNEEEIEPLNEKIADIEGFSVESNDGDKEERGKKTGAKDKVAKRKGGRKGRTRSKSIRSIHLRPRQKDSGTS